jgi:hypothetical protein
MDTTTPDLQSLVARVESLEKQYRWLKSEVVTEKLVLTDADGKARATLRMFEGGPVLGLYDADENNRVCLRVSAEGPFLRLFDAETKRGLELTVDEDGPGVSLFDAKGNTSVVVTVGEQGPVIILFDANGKPRLTMDILPFESSGTPAGERVIPLNNDAMAAILELYKRAQAVGATDLSHCVFPACKFTLRGPKRRGAQLGVA